MDRSMIGKRSHGHTALLPVYMNGPAYGGLICTATGLALFLQDLLRPDPRIFSAATRELFFAQQATNIGRPIPMSVGWRLGRLEDETYLGKPGGGPGFRSNVRLYPKSGLAVAWLANETGVSETHANIVSDLVDRHWIHHA
jgi:D-alanyl-D-alanine carboxypeptidase